MDKKNKVHNKNVDFIDNSEKKCQRTTKESGIVMDIEIYQNRKGKVTQVFIGGNPCQDYCYGAVVIKSNGKKERVEVET